MGWRTAGGLGTSVARMKLTFCHGPANAVASQPQLAAVRLQGATAACLLVHDATVMHVALREFQPHTGHLALRKCKQP